jgi:hypothetical protein
MDEQAGLRDGLLGFSLAAQDARADELHRTLRPFWWLPETDEIGFCGGTGSGGRIPGSLCFL